MFLKQKKNMKRKLKKALGENTLLFFFFCRRHFSMMKWKNVCWQEVVPWSGRVRKKGVKTHLCYKNTKIFEWVNEKMKIRRYTTKRSEWKVWTSGWFILTSYNFDYPLCMQWSGLWKRLSKWRNELPKYENE